MNFSFNALYIVSGFAVGLLVGLTGVGGGSLMTPLLTALFGIAPSVAVGTDLAFAAITKGAGTVIHRVKGNIDWRIVALLAGGSLPASVATTLVLHALHVDKAAPHSGPDHFIRWSIAICVMLTVTVLLFKPKLMAFLESHPNLLLEGRTREFATWIAGIILGVLVTVSSIGAGAIGATILIMLYPKLRSSEIAGTDIAHAVPLTAVAAFGHATLGTLNWALLGALLIGSIPGISIGSFLSRSVPEKFLRGVLATTLTLVAAKLVL